MRRFLFLLVGGGLLALVLLGVCYVRWHHLWQPDNRRACYAVMPHGDDALQVVMIGDSWAGQHQEGCWDTLLRQHIRHLVGRPVRMTSKGKGGEVSRGIYRLLFESNGAGFRPLLEQAPDYCVISAGINDATKCLGPSQYVAHCGLIFDLLLEMGVCPVVLEVPDVDIAFIHGKKPLADKTADYLKAWMAGCWPYDISSYRRALHVLLEKKKYKDKVICVPMLGWNTTGKQLDTPLFQEDRIHLNSRGYERLDSCIAAAIAQREKRCGRTNLSIDQ